MKVGDVKLGVIVLALALMLGCDSPRPVLEDCTIVVVHTERKVGEADSQTIVEFPNQERRARRGTWGNECDVFKCRKSDNTWGWQ